MRKWSEMRAFIFRAQIEMLEGCTSREIHIRKSNWTIQGTVCAQFKNGHASPDCVPQCFFYI